MVFDRKGDLIAKYVKLHPFCFTHEDDYFVAGNNVVHFNILGMPSSSMAPIFRRTVRVGGLFMRLPVLVFEGRKNQSARRRAMPSCRLRMTRITPQKTRPAPASSRAVTGACMKKTLNSMPHRA